MDTLGNKADDASGDLFSAAQRGEVDRVTALLAAADTREITVQEEMHGALCIAIRNDFPAVVRVLCAAGAHFGLAVRKWAIRFAIPRTTVINTRSDFQPIHLAASAGSASCISELASHFQVSVRARDTGGDTPLHWACFFAHVDAVRQLLAVKALARYENANLHTPLAVAATYVHIRCVKALVATQLEEAVRQRAMHRARYIGENWRAIDRLLARALRLHKAAAAE